MAKQEEPNWGRLTALGLEIAIGVSLGAIVGSWVDRKYRCEPWGVLIGAALGFAAGAYQLIKEGFRINKD